ncbi:MAG TPA: hypothetical protein DEG17_13195, partial [Cyanobacteria bacterium UBA11149]|nr:hypothetical protein [Cyanobacteria bacterium UBA11166]HBW89796.1 hypothetical protein [Cyanobacteria bacterium UBA11149]
ASSPSLYLLSVTENCDSLSVIQFFYNLYPDLIITAIHLKYRFKMMDCDRVRAGEAIAIIPSYLGQIFPNFSHSIPKEKCLKASANGGLGIFRAAMRL